MEPVEKIGYSILLIGLLLIALIPMDKVTTTEETRFYRVDSISSRLKYEVMPEKIYTYHTVIGPIMLSNNRYKVGDSIQIKIIRY
jgi:hypothetical protein